MSQNKKWVFSELVKKPDQANQLIAYAIYKADKDDQANSHRAKGLTEDEIKAKLFDFHELIVHSPRQLQNYRDRANTLIEEVVKTISSNVENRLVKEHKAVTDRLDKQLKETEKRTLNEYHKKVINTPASKGFGSWAFNFTVSGLSGVWASILIGIIFFGVSASFSDTETKTYLKNHAVNSVTDTLFPNSNAVLPKNNESQVAKEALILATPQVQK